MRKLHFLVITSLLLIADAEPPRYRFKKSRQTFQRQQLESTSTESSTDLTTNQPETGPYPPAMAPYPAAGYRPGRAFPLPTETKNTTTTDTPSGPYPPSGWKPKGRQLELPTEEQTQPPATYGPPLSEYGPPSELYGPPSELYGPPQEAATESTNEPDDDAVAIDAEIDETGPSKSQEGFYFITLPDGTVQKVSYSTLPGGKIVLKAEAIGRRPEAVVVESQSSPRVVSFVQQYQRW